MLCDTPLLANNRINDLLSSIGPMRLLKKQALIVRRRNLLAISWLLAVGVELAWQASLWLTPTWAVALSGPHLVV